ncbi:MAG: hypothetical protein A3F78_03410 [Burkholderiales bacterium RIFCSPLOWO2_12_FULL_61_40]|nr:MAG: hypothetical protein A3F78_03410 [Burkholderiales bacterium RIFCSPLOWO2_12_FULL_61_40]
MKVKRCEAVTKISANTPMGAVDRLIQVVQLGAEVLELHAVTYRLQRLAALKPAVLGVQPAVAGVQVGGNVGQGHGLPGAVVVVRGEGAFGHVLPQDGAELCGRQPERQRVDLVHEQRLFGVVHDGGVVPVEHRIGLACGVITGAVFTMLGKQGAQCRVVAR